MSAIQRKYGESAIIQFPLVDRGTIDFEATPSTFASGDSQISKDGSTFSNTSNTPSHIGNGIYTVALTTSETQAARIVVTVKDQSSTKIWEDQAILVETYGNASAQHAFDLDTAKVSVQSTGIDDIWDEPVTEPSSVFAWSTATPRNIIGWVGALNRNKIVQNSTRTALRNDADGANIASANVADDGSTFTRSSWT